MITVLNAGGSRVDVGEDDSVLTLEWLQEQVGGYIEVVESRTGLGQLVLNEEGKIEGLEHNPMAQVWWDQNEDFPDDVIVGTCVLITEPNRLR